MAHIINIEGKAEIQWLAQRSGSGRWIGVCEAMNLSTEAESLDELHSVINETIQLVLLDLLRDNELDKFLKDHGWRTTHMPMNKIDQADIEFNVPWQLIAKGNRDSQRRSH